MIDYNSIPQDQVIQNTISEIEKRGIKVILVNNREQALSKIKELIPQKAEVMNGSSTTLIEIGFTDYLKKGNHPWRNLHVKILKEKNQEKQAELRRKSVTAEYFLGSVNAIAQTGELVAADASGSRIGAYPFSAANVILVSGVNKIVTSLEAAIKRVREYVFPLENERAKKAYGMSSVIGKMLIIEKEIVPGRIVLILVKEKLGF